MVRVIGTHHSTHIAAAVAGVQLQCRYALLSVLGLYRGRKGKRPVKGPLAMMEKYPL